MYFLCKGTPEIQECFIFHLVKNLVLQQVSFFFDHRRFTELWNHDPSVAFRQLTASKISERALQVSSVTLWKSVGASNKEAAGASSPDHLAAFMLSELPASFLVLVLTLQVEALAYLETKGIPDIHRTNFQKSWRCLSQ